MLNALDFSCQCSSWELMWKYVKARMVFSSCTLGLLMMHYWILFYYILIPGYFSRKQKFLLCVLCYVAYYHYILCQIFSKKLAYLSGCAHMKYYVLLLTLL